MTLLDLLTATPAERFAVWIEANGNVYDLFRAFALEVRNAGYTRFSADAICHRIRWHLTIETRPLPGDVFKFNDHTTAYLARKLIAEDASFATFFETRSIRNG